MKSNCEQENMYKATLLLLLHISTNRRQNVIMLEFNIEGFEI